MAVPGERRRSWATRDRRDESGYFVAMLALSLTVVMVSAAFVVDVGGWYAVGSRMKRAADAAALAGVVWMPDFPTARSVALGAAARNGWVPGADVSITVSPDPGNSRRLSVSITDTKAPQTFSKIFQGSQSLTRSATAEYVLPVPLGSPKNTFGTGDLLPGTDRENFWAAANGYCAGHESGDLKLARFESYTTASGGAPQCNNGSAQSPDYDPTGYLYAIELPQAQTSLKLEVYDGGYNTSGSSPDLALASDPQAVTTVFEVYGADNTPLDTSDNPLLSTTTITTDDVVRQNLWTPLYTWVNPSAGTYYLRIKTSPQTTESRASNGFGLRASTGLLFTPCTTISGQPGYSASCPQIHGVGDMSIFANLGGAAGSVASFYLAQIDPVHAGKTMQVSLFDAGEGAQKIEVLDPNGSPATFNWSTTCNPPTPPTGGCSGSNVTSLDVSGTGTQPYAGLRGTSKYNDRKMTLDIKLPVNYTALYGTRNWWQIRYTVGTTPTDRTTWSVNIVGDPVHLVGG
ncbi:MAG: pilus assembly protein TadG-related protein [Actinomycetota bacterium]|nr:pilus assembly protein TadG-related protein [Actinomycetota bacterium]